MNKQESFEVAEYSEPQLGIADAHRVIKQFFADIKREAPAHAVWGDMSGDQLKIHYHVYTMHLPVRMKQVDEECEAIIKDTVRLLKDYFKNNTKKTLKLSEMKELANRSIEKVSLNERYYYKAWRIYKVSF